MARLIESYGPAEIAHGPLFVGLFFNSILFGTPRALMKTSPTGLTFQFKGIMIIQTYLYFITYRSDKAWTKIFVFCVFVLDTLNTAFDFAYLYECLIVHYGDVAKLTRANWLFATDPVMTVLTRNRWLVGAVIASVLVAFAGGVATSIEVHMHPRFLDFIKFESVVIIWLAASAIADIFITTILVIHLVSKSHKTGLAGTDMLVDQIIRSKSIVSPPWWSIPDDPHSQVTVQTGLATSLCATIDLILFLTDPVALHLIFNIPLCKLYTNSLLSSLNARAAPENSSTDTSLTKKRASLQIYPGNARRSVLIDVVNPPVHSLV
ncbi:hypothetical protein MIND_00160900 [Mycena indigotica]|uniref:DUF6534 domain-containing protein n=1 Tax=Mycena indigotica TaxID=2126181 RepID=A0A8H6TGT5_9AGAR|nr:uncharacterized protein MIND_00160900 [Mycena indigotica]KAF7316421.1 hypothetical protein MIND_00160900 [Mycena indigotica]